MSKKLGLYIHIPFCKTICVYCAFATFANKSGQIDQYLEKLCQEIEQKKLIDQNYVVDSIYFGGGTPSLLSAPQIEKILTKVRTNFEIKEDCEISIECNPESLNQEKLLAYRQLGITRISLGAQSLNNQTLWKIARPHNSEQTIQALELLHKLGWKNFGVDLIIGLPYQTETSFQSDIEKILQFKPAHLSAYFLSYDTNRIDTFLKESPSEEIQVKIYNSLIQKLAQEGFIHYEVSNYAQPGFQCRHNLKYWRQEEYLGFGLAAHSFMNDELLENSKIFNQYLSGNFLADRYPLTADEKRMDLIMLSLRTNQGLNLEQYTQQFGLLATEKLLKLASSFLANKELKFSNKNLILSEQGYLFADRIYQTLI